MNIPRTDICKPENREAVLTERRRMKMAFSAHSYVRGSTLKFYEWLGSSTAQSLPQGPHVWICGDCHLGNLGPVADAKGRVKIAIRDLDALSGDEDARRLGDDLPQDPRNVPVSTEKGSKSLLVF
jgi:uncharacterized protein (DUF2252 family)